MILSVNEVELLKLLCRCKNAPAPSAWSIGIFNTQNISALEYTGLVFMSRNGKYIRPRPSAYGLLEQAGYSFKADAAPQTRQRVLDRRNIAAKILLTFYAAGTDVFKDTPTDAPGGAVYVPSFAARSTSTGNPFGSTRFYGIFRCGKLLCMVFYADDAGIYFQKELTLFHSYADKIPDCQMGLIFMGDALADIGSSVFRGDSPSDQPKRRYHADSFGKVFSVTSLPVHFVPVGSVGAQMLRYMTMECYRERLAKGVLRKSYRPPYDTLTDTDAIHYRSPYLPAVVALDLDLKRIDRAVSAAKARGYPKAVLYALPEQVLFLRERYREAADVLAVDAERLDREVGIEGGIPNGYAPYFTAEGRCIDVADFTVYRKAKA